MIGVPTLMDAPEDLDSTAIVRDRFAVFCQRLRRELDPVVAHAVSFYDAAGRVRWMTCSLLNEELAASAAAAHFSAPRRDAYFVKHLGHGVGQQAAQAQTALAFPLTLGSRRTGFAMIMIDTAVLPRANAERLQDWSRRLRPLLDELVVMQPGLADAPDAVVPSAPSRAIPEPPPAAPKAVRKVVAQPALPVVPKAMAAVARDPLQAAVMRLPITLYVQHLVPLDRDDQHRRYELLWELGESKAFSAALKAVPRPERERKLSSLIDRRVFVELIAWLQAHPEVGQDRHTAISIKLSKEAVYDASFMPFVRTCLQKARLPRGMIGFEIPAATPRKHVPAVVSLAVELEQSGCFLVLDNFTLRTESFNALRLPGLNLVKLSHEVTAGMNDQKIVRAAIPAITQMTRVLGVRTVAKRTKLAADLLRLTAFGIDYVQSVSIAPEIPISALAKRTGRARVATSAARPMEA